MQYIHPGNQHHARDVGDRSVEECSSQPHNFGEAANSTPFSMFRDTYCHVVARITRKRLVKIKSRFGDCLFHDILDGVP